MTFADLPSGWKWAQFKDIAAKSNYPIGDGDHGAIKPSTYQDQGIPYIRVADLVKGEISTDKMVYIPESVHQGNPKSHLFPGDILISKTGATIGKVAIIPESIPESNTTASIGKITLDSELADNRYVCRFMETNFFQAQMWRVSKKSAQPGFNIKDLKIFQIPLPPLEEQRRIAGILDAADVLRAKRREALAELDTLLQSTFLDMFGDPVTNPKGWEMGHLADVVESLDGGKNVAQSETETDYRVLKVSAVTSGVYRPEESKFLPDDFKVPKSYLVGEGDLLISRANTVELVGGTAYVWETPENIVLPDKIWKFIWKKDAQIEPLFIYHMSKDPKFRRILASRASGTSGSMKNIAKPKLLSLPIPIPPLNLQGRFASIVESVEEQKKHMRAHMAELDDLFGSLQQRAFAGEL